MLPIIHYDRTRRYLWGVWQVMSAVAHQGEHGTHRIVDATSTNSAAVTVLGIVLRDPNAKFDCSSLMMDDSTASKY
jgi:hypothetical protein